VAEVLVITGPPGAGKSTVARLVAATFETCALVQGDVFFGFVTQGYIDPWLPESHEQNTVVTEVSAAAAAGFARGGFTTVFDGMVGPWFLPTFLEYTRLGTIDYAVLLPNVDVCVARVIDREGHGFRDEDVTRRMHASFTAADLDERHVIADVPGVPDEVAADVIRRFESGTLVVHADGS
jgi:cytidylate kinase